MYVDGVQPGIQDTLHAATVQLLAEAGPGKMMGTAYDTAWIARLGRVDAALAAQALGWLRRNQLTDGSWGAAGVVYHHDRSICTLVALIALTEHGAEADSGCIERGKLALAYHLNRLHLDPAGETIGFEMIMPTLLKEAAALGMLTAVSPELAARMEQKRALKLAKTPGGMISRFVTLAFSAEMAGADQTHILDAPNLLEANGSVGHSPSATAYYVRYLAPGDRRALAYLRDVLSASGAPNVSPFDIFEPAWVLWNLSTNVRLDRDSLALAQRHLDFLEQSWDAETGIGHAAGYTPRDGDDTSFIFELLRRFGRDVPATAVFHYEQESHFRCFALESNPSISTNIHALGALRQAGRQPNDPAVQKVVRFLVQAETEAGYWFDKWHASPYYPTAHMVIASAGYLDTLVQHSIDWILGTQREDGSWGFYGATAEETAYCVQALAAWQRAGHPVPQAALALAAAWLRRHLHAPYAPLWIGKCLYVPVLVVRSAILGALTAVYTSPAAQPLRLPAAAWHRSSAADRRRIAYQTGQPG